MIFPPVIIIVSLCIYCWFFLSSPTTIFLVRHADKLGANDQLSPSGLTRASELKRVLKEADITVIYASQFNRTQQTATPLATELGVAITLYSTNDLAQLANTIKTTHKGKNVLVVGHSNTVPTTIGLLGISPQPPNIPENEYDHLYILTRHSKIKDKLIKLRYGVPTP